MIDHDSINRCVAAVVTGQFEPAQEKQNNMHMQHSKQECLANTLDL